MSDTLTVPLGQRAYGLAAASSSQSTSSLAPGVMDIVMQTLTLEERCRTLVATLRDRRLEYESLQRTNESVLLQIYHLEQKVCACIHDEEKLLSMPITTTMTTSETYLTILKAQRQLLDRQLQSKFTERVRLGDALFEQINLYHKALQELRNISAFMEETFRSINSQGGIRFSWEEVRQVINHICTPLQQTLHQLNEEQQCPICNDHKYTHVFSCCYHLVCESCVHTLTTPTTTTTTRMNAADTTSSTTTYVCPFCRQINPPISALRW